MSTSGRTTCGGCNLSFGGAERTIQFEGQQWHQHCLLSRAHKVLRAYDPQLRISNFRLLGNRIIEILRDLSQRAERERQRFMDLIRFCVNFVRDAIENPSAIPEPFQTLDSAA